MSKPTIEVLSIEELSAHVCEVAAGMQAVMAGRPVLAISFVLLELLRGEPELLAEMEALRAKGMERLLDERAVPLGASGGDEVDA